MTDPHPDRPAGRPLHGLRIIEFAGIGPGPFCGMMLADHGAEVIRIERPGGLPMDPRDPLSRNRRSIALDLKNEGARDVARQLCATADGIIEGYRPGVMERLGLGPDVLMAEHPALVYGRVTGWGQDGPWSQAAGHDINYIALSGVLHTVGAAGGKPVPPVNYIGDFAGGGMMLAFGMAAALLDVMRGAPGRIVDAAMTDGSALIAGMTWWFHAAGLWRDERGVNRLDGGAPYYDTYVCADGRAVAIGAIEPGFYALLIERLGLGQDPLFAAQDDQSRWPAQRAALAALFASRPRDAWCALFDASDACLAPVLSLAEAPDHAHNKARGTFVTVNGHPQPAPAPRYVGEAAVMPRPAPTPGRDGRVLLTELGMDAERIDALAASGAVRLPPDQ